MINSITMYSTSLCNLNCSYCFISKNKALMELDKLLDEASKGDYYINLIHEYVGDMSDIKTLEIWGGEPTIHLDRAYNLIGQLCKECKNFKKIFFSSNYCSENFIESFSGLVNYLGSIKDRDFTIYSQISIDGLPCINDKYRGNGVTDKIIKNFNRLLNIDYPNNVKILFGCKPTLSLETASMLLDKNFVLSYFKFFEDNFIDKANNSNNKAILKMRPPLPNLASPDEYTSEDGKLFCEIEKTLYEVENHNIVNNSLKYYKNLRMFRKNKKNTPKYGYIFRGGFCGTGRSMIGLLPFGKACGCHRDFANFFESYMKEAHKDSYKKIIRMDNVKDYSMNNKVLVFNNKYDFIRHEERISNFYDTPSTTLITSMMAIIKVLAHTKQIDEKYIEEEEARRAAYKMLYTFSVCAENNLSINGNCSVIPVSNYRLFLNGAIDYIYKE